MKRKSSDDPTATADAAATAAAADESENPANLPSSKGGEGSFNVHADSFKFELEQKLDSSDEHDNNKKKKFESDDVEVTGLTIRTQRPQRPDDARPPSHYRQGPPPPGDYYTPSLKETSITGEAPALPTTRDTEIGASRRNDDMPSNQSHYIANATSFDDIRTRGSYHEDMGGDLQIHPHLQSHQQLQPQPQQPMMLPTRYGAGPGRRQDGLGNYPHPRTQTMQHTDGRMYNTGGSLAHPDLFQRLQTSHHQHHQHQHQHQFHPNSSTQELEQHQHQHQFHPNNSSTQQLEQQLSMMQAMQVGAGYPGYAARSMYNSNYDPLPPSNLLGYSQQHVPLPPFPLGTPIAARYTTPLATHDDESWLSTYLCFVRAHCVEVFTASMSDVLSRNNSKKISEDQVGIRCRFCAHLPHRSRARRSSSFPSSKSRIYQSLTMMLRDHFPKCGAMPPEAQERFVALKNAPSQGATDSKRYWTESADILGLVDTSEGIKFASFAADAGEHH